MSGGWPCCCTEGIGASVCTSCDNDVGPPMFHLTVTGMAEDLGNPGTCTRINGTWNMNRCVIQDFDNPGISSTCVWECCSSVGSEVVCNEFRLDCMSVTVSIKWTFAPLNYEVRVSFNSFLEFALDLGAITPVCKLFNALVIPFDVNTSSECDHTGATVTLTAANSEFCCTAQGCLEDQLDNLPVQVRVVLAGMGNSGVPASTCANCASLNGTYILDLSRTIPNTRIECYWTFDIPFACGYLKLMLSNDDFGLWQVRISDLGYWQTAPLHDFVNFTDATQVVPSDCRGWSNVVYTATTAELFPSPVCAAGVGGASPATATVTAL